MKKTQKITPLVGQPVFHKVAENLYRLESSGGYYALLKRGGKQFRRSLKTKDRKLADRLLGELRTKVGSLKISPDAKLNFEQAAKLWLETEKHSLSSNTVHRRGMYFKGLVPNFGNTPLRNITDQDCDRWVQERGVSLAPETFNHELDIMKGVFEFALDRGLILSNPAKRIKRRRVVSKQIAVPGLEQFKQLVAAIRQADGHKGNQERNKDGADLIEFLAYSGARIGEVIGGKDANEKRPLYWSDVNFQNNTIFLPGTKTEAAPRTIPMSSNLRALLTRLNSQGNPTPSSRIIPIKSARKCLQSTCKKLEFPKFTHHDFRHFFATTCIESGVDIPTVSRWLGHKDGGALAMKRYGHLRQEHSLAMIKKVSFDKPANVIPLPKPEDVKTGETNPTPDNRRAIAKAKTKYAYPWWVSENPLEVFWGQLQEQVWIVPIEKFLETAKQAMGRQVFKQEFDDRLALVDEFLERTPEATRRDLLAKIPALNSEVANNEHAAN
ncbi:MAG TPA: tyrosine-type recombinase/integrase [Candidatus Sulfotelmatobacter sp.]|nr:tyrosine-type recombinase/integrase [Candidatus Sulfotelmatobacter sp.]